MYTILSQNSYFIRASTLSRYWQINDMPVKKGEDILKAYIKDAHAVFTNTTRSLTDFNKKFTKNDETHLKNMLGLLADARNTWEEENSQ